MDTSNGSSGTPGSTSGGNGQTQGQPAGAPNPSTSAQGGAPANPSSGSGGQTAKPSDGQQPNRTAKAYTDRQLNALIERKRTEWETERQAQEQSQQTEAQRAKQIADGKFETAWTEEANAHKTTKQQLQEVKSNLAHLESWLDDQLAARVASYPEFIQERDPARRKEKYTVQERMAWIEEVEAIMAAAQGQGQNGVTGSADNQQLQPRFGNTGNGGAPAAGEGAGGGNQPDRFSLYRQAPGNRPGPAPAGNREMSPEERARHRDEVRRRNSFSL